MNSLTESTGGGNSLGATAPFTEVTSPRPPASRLQIVGGVPPPVTVIVGGVPPPFAVRASRSLCGLQQIRADEAVEIAVEHPRRVAHLVVGAVVLDHRVGVQHVGADL